MNRPYDRFQVAHHIFTKCQYTGSTTSRKASKMRLRRGLRVMKRPSTTIKAQMVGMGMRPAWSRGRLNRGWMTGLWMGLLVVLACTSAQAQTMEDRIEKLENTMSQMTKALPVWRKRFEF